MKYEKNLTDISDKDRFFCYAWSYEGFQPDTTKFGDRWVPAGKDAYSECATRVRQSLGVMKHEFDTNRVTIHAIWDVSEYAKKHDKFKIHGKIDSTIGDEIGLRIKDDLYNRSPDDLVNKVNKILIKSNQPLPKCGLTAWQYRAVSETLTAINDGAATILADMCARAGKTLYVGAMVKEYQAPLTVVTSYVLTSFTSFINDLSSFAQFTNIELVDSKDDDYKNRVKSALKEGKQVIVFVSLCKGGMENSKRDDRIKFLFSVNKKVMLVIDEADYGAWKPGQSDPLVKHRRENDIVIVMTGTNSDRAIGGWGIDDVVQVTYPEMLMEKYHHLPVKTTPKISHFAVDVSRHALVVDVKFYQMGLKNVVESARAKNPDLFVDDGQFAPASTEFLTTTLRKKPKSKLKLQEMTVKRFLFSQHVLHSVRSVLEKSLRCFLHTTTARLGQRSKKFHEVLLPMKLGRLDELSVCHSTPVEMTSLIALYFKPRLIIKRPTSFRLSKIRLILFLRL